MQPIQTAVWCSDEDLQDLDLKQRRIEASLPWKQTQGSEQKGQSPHVYTEQMTTEVTYWGSARKSTIKTTSTFSHADIYSFCLYFLFLKPTPSPTQCFLIQATLSETTAQRKPTTMHKLTWEKEGTLIVEVCTDKHHCPDAEHATLVTNFIIR